MSNNTMDRAGPRIYVPLSLPDSSVPTYAVLEFVGFSSPAAVLPAPASASASVALPSSSAASPSPSRFNPQLALPSASAPSAMLCLPPAAVAAAAAVVPPASTINQQASFLVNSSLDPVAFSSRSNPAVPSLLPLSSASSFPMHIMTTPSSNQYHAAESTRRAPLSPLNSPQALFHHHHQQKNFSTPAREVVHVVDSPPSSPSTSRATSTSSVNCSAERDTKEHGIVKSGALSTSVNNNSQAGTAAPSSDSRKPQSHDNGGALITPQPAISVSQTDRGTIVHTHSSNFRDVVRQLTGASSGDQDLLPVTLPARLVNRGCNSNSNTPSCHNNNEAPTGYTIANSKVDQTKTQAELGLRKAPLKLHERRKAMRSLEKLSTAYAELPPLVPSPVTPLASDFEKFCTATTPTASSSNNTTSQGSSVVVVSPRQVPPQLMNAAPEHGDCVIVDQRCASPASALAHAANNNNNNNNHNNILLKDSFYVHPGPRPAEKPSPTLLNLFPESPVCSPRDL